MSSCDNKDHSMPAFPDINSKDKLERVGERGRICNLFLMSKSLQDPSKTCFLRWKNTEMVQEICKAITLGTADPAALMSA